MIEEKVVALFDFDGTITRKDSLPVFIRYIKGDYAYFSGLIRLAPSLILFKAGFLTNSEAKQRLFEHYFGGIEINIFQKACNSFGLNIIQLLVREDAIQKIKEHQQKKHRVIIVSASCENWLSAWCNDMGVELLGTRLEVINNIVTGKLSGANCYGQEKVKRLAEITDIKSYTGVYAYGDSKGDTELLSIATDPYYKVFKGK